MAKTEEYKCRVCGRSVFGRRICRDCAAGRVPARNLAPGLYRVERRA